LTVADKGNISTVLKRNLKDGKEYEKLIPRVKCERTTLGKGDTFFTVDSMKAWIEKYRFQTEKLALKLKGRTLEETVNNIYSFLYNHIQYEADGSLQQLRSSACTWMQRHQGVDCKSFSVFASSILSNLGIKHAIRQVRQPGFFPDQFTHVYVVVPKNQNLKDFSNSTTFVLDATKHQNIEGSFLEKVDLPMTKLNHIGLNAPQDERAQKLVGNFNRFTQTLLRFGVDLPTVNAIRQKVSDYTTKGQDPKIDIVRDGMVIEGVLFPLVLKRKIPFVAVQNAFYGGLKNPGLSSFATLFENFEGTLETASSGNGDMAAGIVDGGLEIAASAIPFGSIIKNILDKIGLATNISNVLKYGLSSWGASTTPEDTQKRFAEVGLTWLQAEIASVTPSNIDTKLTGIDIMLTGNANFAEGLMHNHSRAKSTRLANEWVMNECRKLRDEIIKEFDAQLRSKGVKVSVKTVPAESSELNRYPITSMTTKGMDLKGDRYWNTTKFSIYTVDKNSLNSWNTNQQSGGSTTGGSTGGNNIQPGETANINDGSGSKPNQALLIGGMALASIPLFFIMKKGSVAANAPAARRSTPKKTKK